jgi:hypothetical protein
MVLMRIAGYHGFDLPQDDGATKTQNGSCCSWFVEVVSTEFWQKQKRDSVQNKFFQPSINKRQIVKRRYT